MVPVRIASKARLLLKIYGFDREIVLMTEPTNQETSGRNQRRIRNLLLKPKLQLTIGFYSVALSLIVAAALAAVFYITFSRVFDLILELSDMRDDVLSLLWEQLLSASTAVAILLFIYVVTNIAIAIVMTHRLIGPTIAFRRHISCLRAGQFESRIILRQADAFLEVAKDLNELAADLEQKKIQIK